MIRITTLIDNKLSANEKLGSEHGLSYLVEKDGFRLLFDSGATSLVRKNAAELGISLKDLDAVAISHGHYDHAGGYRSLIENGEGAPLLYTGEKFFEKKLAALDDGGTRDLSTGFSEEYLKEHGIEHRVVSDRQEIFPGIWLLTGFPRIHDFETIPARFVKETAKGIIPDTFPDEICCVLDTKEGSVVLVGCSHPGILNIVTHVKNIFTRPVAAVYGGTHLMAATRARTELTIQRLKEMGVGVMGLGHCSGELVEEILKTRTDIRSRHMGPGDMAVYEE